jgi:hypothetical protein
MNSAAVLAPCYPFCAAQNGNGWIVTKTNILGLLAAATVALAVPATSAKAAVVYELSGTAINTPSVGAIFSFVYTSPTFITSFQNDVTLDSCSISDPAYTCTVASFIPSSDKAPFGVFDQIDFKWTNVDLSGGGGAQLLFALGAFTTPGTYNVGPISMSDNAVLTVHVTDVGETPIPGALPLFATGLGAMGLLGWRRKRKAATPAAWLSTF